MSGRRTLDSNKEAIGLRLRDARGVDQERLKLTAPQLSETDRSFLMRSASRHWVERTNGPISSTCLVAF